MQTSNARVCVWGGGGEHYVHRYKNEQGGLSRGNCLTLILEIQQPTKCDISGKNPKRRLEGTRA